LAIVLQSSLVSLALVMVEKNRNSWYLKMLKTGYSTQSKCTVNDG